ncbi:S8 family serine peptidase [Pontiella agarivorans]|uniref:S8 family serine peptidase n=1 Tax=Pontiella agarivorans TaxID=3038953 RepID=A0ABU5MVX0_9BACT|nr:S8 family serine peptidase [Pontiella agarivorans]MDZ8118369.1 S8 family serine peptidase [Pontiella agarivorans]
MRVYKVSLILLIAFPVLNTGAQLVSTYEVKPELRKADSDWMWLESTVDKIKAEEWAAVNHMPVRIDDGRTLAELVAVRDGKPVYIKTHNANAAISTGANLIRDVSPYNLDGDGVIVGVWDGGEVLTTHREFGTRVTDKDAVASHWHATHVGGTIAASGVTSSAKGMAPAAMIYSHDWTSDISEMTTEAASAPGQQSAKIYLSNHSYGYFTGWEDGTFYGFEDFGKYNSNARSTDIMVYNAQYFLPFWSAGNDRNDAGDGSHEGDGKYKDGYDTISDNAIGKNVMTVGAVSDAVSGGGRNVSRAGMSAFSSWGPADDGRIKPDIVANGVNLYSCDDDNNSDYTHSSGTSMSSPNACGSAALLVEYYKELFPPDGAMRASTLKGLIIHTADDLGNAGPDYSYGWGLMNTKAAADLLKDYAGGSVQRLKEGLLHETTNTVDTFTVAASGNEPLRITICWTDPAGPTQSTSDSRTKVLVNDLDLRVTGPGGTYYPFVLSYSVPEAAATTGDNDIDNVEQVLIDSSIPGNYTVEVSFKGSELAGDSQRYSMLVSGISSDSDTDSIPDFWEMQYFGSTTGALASLDSDGDGADNLTEYISGFDPTDPASVFAITTQEAGPDGGAPFVITWNAVEGRVYNVKLSNNLLYDPFAGNESLSGDLPYPADSFTDLVERVTSPVFYQVDVRLAD